MTQYSLMIILTAFFFHAIFEGYYLCLIIGLSQIVANIDVLESPDVEIAQFRDNHLKEFFIEHRKTSDSNKMSNSAK